MNVFDVTREGRKVLVDLVTLAPLDVLPNGATVVAVDLTCEQRDGLNDALVLAITPHSRRTYVVWRVNELGEARWGHYEDGDAVGFLRATSDLKRRANS